MKKIVLPTFLLLAIAGASAHAQTAFSEEARNRAITQLRSVRMMADAEARDCFQENRTEVARILVDVSTHASALSNKVSSRRISWEQYSNEILNRGLNDLRTQLLAYTNYRNCEPTKVRDELDLLLAPVQTGPQTLKVGLRMLYTCTAGRR